MNDQDPRPEPPPVERDDLGPEGAASMVANPIVGEEHQLGSGRVEFLDTGRLQSPLTLYRIMSDDRLRMVLGWRELKWNEMAARPEADGIAITDAMVGRSRVELEKFIRVFTAKGKAVPLVASASEIWEAVLSVSHEHRYHPVREYLSRLPPWDGVERLAMFAQQILGVERPTPLEHEMIRCWFVSAVARAMVPGCKVDTMLILISPQGRKKSSLFSALAEPWFSDAAVPRDDLGSRDTCQIAAAAWIWEWAELSVFRGAAGIEALKAYLSRREDRYVGKWQRAETTVPRSFVLCGSSNNQQCLPDDEENRRFWPIATGQIDVAKARAWRPQLWAEALAAYRVAPRWWLADESAVELQRAQMGHVAVDPWVDLVVDYCANRDEVTMADVLSDSAISKQPGSWTRADQMRVASILVRTGWRRTLRYDKRWVYRRTR